MFLEDLLARQGRMTTSLHLLLGEKLQGHLLAAIDLGCQLLLSLILLLV